MKRVKSTENFLGKCSLNGAQIHVEINSTAFKEMWLSERLNEKEITIRIIKTLRHELRHVLQIFFIYSYVRDVRKMNKIVEKINRSFDYFNNPLEVDARAHENVPITSTDCGLVMSRLLNKFHA